MLFGAMRYRIDSFRDLSTRVMWQHLGAAHFCLIPAMIISDMLSSFIVFAGELHTARESRIGDFLHSILTGC